MLLTIFVIIPSKFIKIKIDKILFNIIYVTKILRDLVILSIENKIFAKLN